MAALPPLPRLHVRDMRVDDARAAGAVLDAGGWGERSAFFRHLLTVPSCQVLVGEVDGRVAATGVASVFGRVGWVGTIFVDHTLRRRGYGEAITEAVCERLEAAGCETLALIASDLGQPIYERMGFRIDAWHATYHPPSDGAARSLGRVATAADRQVAARPATSDDLATVFRLDAEATASDRSALLRSILERTWVAGSRGAITGFLASIDAGSSAIVAMDEEAAAALLDVAAHVAPRALANAIDGNPVQQQVLSERGWTEVVRSPRMVRGPSVAWQPERLWGLLGRAFG